MLPILTEKCGVMWWTEARRRGIPPPQHTYANPFTRKGGLSPRPSNIQGRISFNVSYVLYNEDAQGMVQCVWLAQCNLMCNPPQINLSISRQYTQIELVIPLSTSISVLVTCLRLTHTWSSNTLENLTWFYNNIPYERWTTNWMLLFLFCFCSLEFPINECTVESGKTHCLSLWKCG